MSALVISQVYGGGGNSGAPYRNDFVEIFNRGTTPVNLSGWSVQYASASGTSWQVTNLTNLTLAPGQYYLVQQAGGANGSSLPAADAAGQINLSATAGKVALVNQTAVLVGACPAGAAVVDFVGYGNANCFEGEAGAPAASNTNAVLRAASGCADTNRNGADFSAAAPAPRNSTSAAAPCVGGGVPVSVAPHGRAVALHLAVLPVVPGLLVVFILSARGQVKARRSLFGRRGGRGG